mmetsp:Transcript_33215/g.48054  ORF Transcript_33215/g.48054 Transcript_33215/m.48054 type:complete len:94 (-) Transcript_33215:217-498(-)
MEAAHSEARQEKPVKRGLLYYLTCCSSVGEKDEKPQSKTMTTRSGRRLRDSLSFLRHSSFREKSNFKNGVSLDTIEGGKDENGSPILPSLSGQ